MPANARYVICRYHYDPLDRLVGTTPTDDDGLQRFYCKSRLATETQGAVQRSIFQQGEQLLAQKNQQDELAETSLLATDQMRSVLQVLKANRPRPIAHSPYGHRPMGNGLISLLGFNGERPDPITGHYLLGNGYRAFNPVLMRFNSPDNMSPFGKGGLNSYTYCFCDPINYSDSSGHFPFWKIKAFFSRNKKIPSFSPPTSNVSNKYKSYALVLDENVAKKEIVNSYRKVMYSSNSKSKIPIPVMKINSLEQLEVVKNWGRSFKHDPYYTNNRNSVSFIYTEHKELFVGSTGHLMLSTLAKSNRVISAGELIRFNDRSFSITNSSGHFKPAFDSLHPVKKRLERMGANTVELYPHYVPK
ncbi:MAG: RHS repeat-associated core domain-containing protein [Pseudomonadales bacterium]|nr:RHS repeat-associated core domain-containing protein [Pseudomonadales bacterium]MBH2036823.1 RHS repeat-associated core domain-containing protein [Pseudomonadales bacterium]MBH2079945.1 RHS repeat-associated core domain-containing protein [Pseudomonadales bacterium]